jgi:hypothetical protein
MLSNTATPQPPTAKGWTSRGDDDDDDDDEGDNDGDGESVDVHSLMPLR